MECWQDVPDLGDPIAESLGDPSINGSGATPAPTFLLGFQSWGCHLAGSGDPPPRPNVPGTYTPHVCNPWTYSTLHHSACRPPPVPHTVMCTPYAVLPYAVRHPPLCAAVRRTAVHRTPYAVLPYAVRRTGSVPYAVRRTPYAVLPYCRTAVRRTAVLPYAVLPYAVLPYAVLPYAVRRTAVLPYCRTPYAILPYCHTAVHPLRILQSSDRASGSAIQPARPACLPVRHTAVYILPVPTIPPYRARQIIF